MGLIRVSDDAEKKIKEAAEAAGSTITTTVDKMLQSNDIAARLDKMGKWMEKKFVDLEAALDGAVLSNSSYNSSYSSNSSSNSSSASYKSSNSHYGTPVDWETLRDMWLDFLPYEAVEWLPGREEAFRNSDNMDMGVYYIKNGLIVSDDTWGHADWMKVSPRVEEYLSSHGVEI